MTGVVRPAGPGDLAALGRVAYDTAFFGESARRFFPDEALFADLWVRPYLSGGLGFVGLRGGRVVGSILGVTGPAAYRRAWLGAAPTLLSRALAGAYSRLPGCLPYLGRAGLFSLGHAPTSHFPAHLHLNVLEGARGTGLGGRLLDTFLAELGRRGVPGVQLSTTRENVAALALYEKRGFRVWTERERALWRPWLGRNAVHVVMVRRL
ncbi:Acetyltransferase (GNAT) family protein [Deinococcus reticulitermitis]|uniref:Acetyltransferase (GNAT) family protein n=1 Tax=Deinococcus reticulitermitis TaxID=856736 RepID=A0A1H7AMM8_9DEIO|nr:GNAT family N-acetyltransferase [Deinococcus reticulitermitis]SEJ66186.1 Acetyltransferase (GNAT) family protein [Deinococcus reticulitermitis]